ncbi:MAG: hypothetical protein DI618_09010 [Dermacoccus nishinomiyaensis]|nr:MAG: hypothetical protein DI618_09010 [Dermacoccus nishinomiyaensis]
MTDHHVETAPESAVVAPDAGRADGRHPLDVLAEHEFVSRGDELVGRRIAEKDRARSTSQASPRRAPRSRVTRRTRSTSR